MIKFSTGGKLAPLLIHEILHAFIDTRFINFCSIIFFFIPVRINICFCARDFITGKTNKSLLNWLSGLSV